MNTKNFKRIRKNDLRAVTLFLLMICISVFTMFAFTQTSASAKEGDDGNVAIFFVSPTCSSCADTKEYVKSANLELIIYDISVDNNLALLYKYCKEYSVSEDDTGMVPIVFVGDKYLFGYDDITAGLEKILAENTVPTKILEVEKGEEISNLKVVNFMSVLAAGLVNGFNPCSLSLLLFLLTLGMVKPHRVLSYGLSFLAGKFIAFFLLGTLLFNIINKIQLTSVNMLFSVIFVLFAVVFFIVNFYDFLKAKSKKYDKMKLMLPKGLIGKNQKMLRGINFQGSLPVVAVVCFGMGMLVACGEFLCTGQVYLATIIAMIQVAPEFDIKAVIYLLIYDIGFILPLVVVILIINRLKNVQKVSKIFTDKIYIIKLLNSVVFLIFAIFYIVLQQRKG